jgi:hypothetical protein
MLGEVEDLARISALPLEDGRGVMKRVSEDVDVGVAPGNHLAVEPDQAVAVVIGRALAHWRAG